jgi:predicted nucleic acid-binding protein
VATIYTVDASVFLNAFNPYEAGHTDSHRLLAHLQAQAVPLIEPALLFPEVAAAIRRGRDDEALARAFVAALRRLPHLVVVPLDTTLAEQAAGVAAQYCLRGSDAVYTAVALRFGSRLITLDREQLERTGEALPAFYPMEALRAVG